MRLLAFLIFVGLAAGYACAQSTPPVDPHVVLKVAIAGDQREFRIGETIPLQLSFSSTVKKHYQVDMAQSDRSGRTGFEQFTISPSEGWGDPLANHGGSLGGLTTYQFLTAPEPWSVKLSLNEWVRFTQPGEYRLVVFSTRVEVRDPTSPSGTSAVTARSNEITFKIVKADPAWQKRVFNDAVAKLDAPVAGQSNPSDQYAIRNQALQTLRFLGTADATRELVKRMRGQDPGNLDYVCRLGIISSPERAIARTALEEALADADRPIDSNFVHTLSTVTSDPNGGYTEWREARQRVLEQLLAVLPAKRGKAMSISLSTALSEAWNGNALPRQTIEKLTSQLVSMFDKLPLNEQNSLLGGSWFTIKSPALLPIVKRYAQAYSDPDNRLAQSYELRDLSANALRRWYELDPAGARPAIIAEISRPRPRFGARILGLLPDKTLPEVDFALAENFHSVEDFDGKVNVASLIARYATDSILPQVMQELEPKIGKWACDIQNPLLAYVLRVNPVTARTLLERAVAAREFSGCNQGLFLAVSEIYYDPLLEDMAIESLNDPDPQLVQSAAAMLGRFGSPAAESALLKRYASWCEQWAGHEAQLDQMFADGLNDNTYQLGLGQILTQALATGQSWLTDKAALQRLAQQTKVQRVRQQLEDYVKRWEDERLSIFVDASYSRFYASVGQYQYQSMDALKEKLVQFPPGTKFGITLPTVEPTANETAAAEVRSFLTSHGMSVAAGKAP